MKLLKDIAQAWKTIRSGSPTETWLRGGTDDTSPATTLISPLQQSTWVYSAVNALATNVSQIPFTISRSGHRDGEHLVEGPVADLFKRPHPNLDRFQFWELLVSWLQLRGEVFLVALNREGQVIPVREARGRHEIAQLLILSPLRFWHIVEGGELVGWRYTGFGYADPPMESQVFLPEEIMQLRLPNPYDFWRGMAPLSTAMLAAQTDYASAQYMKGLMLNNADTGVIVTTDQQVSAEQREQIMAALRDRKRKAGTADRPLFLWAGAKVEKPATSSVDMQFLENRKLNRLEIGSVFRVPSTVMGFSEDANRAIAEQERLSFIEQTILPLCCRLEAFVEPIIKSFGHDLIGWFDADCLPIMQEARRSRGEAAARFFSMGVPLNDINRTFDLGLPQYPWGATGYLPANVQPVGTVSQPATSTASSSTEESPFARMFHALDLSRTRTPAPANLAPVTPDRRKDFKSRICRFFFEQRSRVLARLSDFIPIAGCKFDDLDHVQHMAVWKVLARTLSEEIFQPEKEDTELLNRIRPLWLNELNTRSLPQETIYKFLNERSAALLAVNQTTLNAIKETLLPGLQGGEGSAQLVERFKIIFQDAANCRAEAIALGEVRALAALGHGHETAPTGAESREQTRILDNAFNPEAI
jgi:HK97 family phage portal protein